MTRLLLTNLHTLATRGRLGGLGSVARTFIDIYDLVSRSFALIQVVLKVLLAFTGWAL